jgi:pimeloyl-ACP methyl ester carboxylesterase
MAELAAVRSPDYSLDASALDVPIHCAYGLLSPQRMRRAAVDLAHEAGVEATVFENAGHGAHLSHPGQFARWILSMIRPT